MRPRFRSWEDNAAFTEQYLAAYGSGRAVSRTLDVVARVGALLLLIVSAPILFAMLVYLWICDMRRNRDLDA